MKTFLPPLRALQAFEAFGRLGSVSSAARELGVTSGAISQQLKALEDHLEMRLVLKDGRRAALTPEARAYHEMIAAGFDRLRGAQDVISRQKTGTDLKISGLPTLLLKWLNPQLHRFQPSPPPEILIRLEATHQEPDAEMLGRIFRLTYGAISTQFPHARPLFTDICFPVCSPDFLTQHPQATTPEGLAELPLVEIDWGARYSNVPRWRDWFAYHELGLPVQKPVVIHTVSSAALEAAAGGQGVALAQLSFASVDLELGRLVRLSDDALTMPEPYFVCWGTSTLDQPHARSFLNWLIATAKALQ